jgi:hypothetical protein
VPDSVPWALVPMCMVPTAQTVRENKYVTTGGVVKFEIGQSGSIVFVAAVAMSLPAGRYVLRAHLERDDPIQINTEPSLLGTNIQLRRRRHQGGGGVEDVLAIPGEGGLPVLGGNGFYTVDSVAENLDDGINVLDHFYWVQLEVRQTSPATAATRNAVTGLELRF